MNAAPTLTRRDEVALQVATFYLGPQLMGFDIAQVQEINRQVQVTPVPQSPPEVRGVLNLRGEVMTVLDLRVILGLRPAELTPDSRNMILTFENEKTGVLVDRIADVVTTTTDQIEPAPANVQTIDGRFFTGVVQLEGELLVILDLQAVLRAQATAEPAAATARACD